MIEISMQNRMAVKDPGGPCSSWHSVTDLAFVVFAHETTTRQQCSWYRTRPSCLPPLEPYADVCFSLLGLAPCADFGHWQELHHTEKLKVTTKWPTYPNLFGPPRD